MKKKFIDILIIIITLFFLYLVMVKKILVYDTVIYSLNLWVNNLVPTLFPFFIISDILINYNITLYIPNFLKKLCKQLFNITNNMLIILILSVISGFPSNARNARTLYDKGFISLDEANHILIFSHFANPLFVLSTVAIFFFKDRNIGIIVLISHYLSNFILGILFRNYFTHNDLVYKKDNVNNDFGNILISSIKKSIDTILLICGIVSVFLIMVTLITNFLNFNIYNTMLIKGFFEITIGIEALSYLDLSFVYKAVITSIFLAFGGLSVHMQVNSQISDTKINYKYFFIGRVYQALISGGITYLICIFVNLN